MQLTIFGATGMVGRQLVQQALFKKYTVKAFGRNVFTTDFRPMEGLELVQGALFDEDEVYAAIKGSDAVLSAIGGSVDGSDQSRSLGMKNIVNQMQKAAVSRIVAVGGSGVLNADEDSYLIDRPNYPAQFLAVGIQHFKAFEYLKNSTLEWTFVCCPDIIDAGPTGQFITNADYPPTPNNFRINAGDLALFMLNEIEKNEFVKRRVGISNL